MSNIMREYLPDHHRVFDDAHITTAFTAGFNVDVEDAFESLCSEPAPDLIRGH